MLCGWAGGRPPGRLNIEKALVVVAAQEDGLGIGRIRMRQIVDASAQNLVPFVQDSVEPGSVIHTCSNRMRIDSGGAAGPGEKSYNSEFSLSRCIHSLLHHH